MNDSIAIVTGASQGIGQAANPGVTLTGRTVYSQARELEWSLDCVIGRVFVLRLRIRVHRSSVEEFLALWRLIHCSVQGVPRHQSFDARSTNHRAAFGGNAWVNGISDPWPAPMKRVHTRDLSHVVGSNAEGQETIERKRGVSSFSHIAF